jgi:hypothetical protein
MSLYENYKCIKFSSYEEADDYYKKYYNQNFENSILLPVCGFTPLFLHKYILHYKLSKTFIKIYF